jgi:hypothetical protein
MTTHNSIAPDQRRQRKPRSKQTAARPRAQLRKLAAGAATALAVVVSAGPLLAASAPEPPSGSGRFLDHHGLVLPAAQLYLIYWGSAWNRTSLPSPTADQITTATRVMMASSYMNGLAQYRGIGHGAVRESAVITSSEPPAGFTKEHVANFLATQIAAGALPGPEPANQTLYAVVMPTGIHSGEADLGGEHSYHTHRGQRIPFFWTADSGSLATATAIISHELVESVTDPEGSAFLGVAGTCTQDGWCEIADVCSATSVLDGVTVRSYWSNQAAACVIPMAETAATSASRSAEWQHAERGDIPSRPPARNPSARKG